MFSRSKLKFQGYLERKALFTLLSPADKEEIFRDIFDKVVTVMNYRRC